MNYKTILVLILFFSVSVSYSQTKTYFVKYKDDVQKSSVEEKISAQNLFNSLNKNSGTPGEYSIKPFAKNLGRNDERLSRIVKVTFKSDAEASRYLQELKDDPNVEYIQPEVIYHIESIPNDSLISEQWALEKIQAYDAWDITQGEDSVIVGVIDTGIDYLHPDIKNKIYFNPGENGTDNSGNDKKSNGIDDDANGFIDDWHGWDFTDRVGFPEDSIADFHTWDNDPMDEHFHGTFVSGILGAETNNNTGMAGTAPNVRILNLRAFDRNGSGEEDDAAAAILYAVQAGAKVINMSFGDASFSYVLRDVIRYAYSRNVVLVASAGNSNSPDPHYPSGYSEVISVGNTTQDDGIGSTNYGSTLDIMAPGTNILSLDLGGDYRFDSGTSASAPFVSGAAALILSLNNFTNDEVKQILKSTTDDIGQTGWDLRTGSGRLNLFKALRILSPAKIRFNYPRQDFATSQDTLNINVNIMSPYFVKYELLYGEGLNPEEWTSLVSDIKYQSINENVFTLQTSGLSEGDYTFRLVVSLSNGSTTEERVNIHIQRTAPNMELVGAGPIYYGNTSTLMGEIFTDDLAVTRMYYRQKGIGDFNFITLDGFATNNQYVKQEHYGIIPKQLVQPNTLYEIYFEAENLVGLKSVLKDNDGGYFEFRTDPFNDQIPFTILPYTLPKGTIFKDPVNFLSNNSSEILFDIFYEKPDSFDVSYGLYSLSDDSFIKNDSILNKIPVESGDFNNDGKTDLLSIFYPISFIDEQTNSGEFKLVNKQKIAFSKDTSFFPVVIEDLNNDNVTEVYSNYYDSVTTVWNITDNLKVDSAARFVNYTFIDNYDKSLGSLVNTTNRNAFVTADLNGDGVREIWQADYDGDLFSYKPSGDTYAKGDSLIEKYFVINQNKVLAAGDFDGDGTDEIAVLYQSNSIASYFFLRIFNFKNNKENILYEKVFLDQSAEYSGINFTKFYQSLRFADIDNDNSDELVANIYPYVYVIKNSLPDSKVIYYAEEVNTETIFAGDLNKNGVTEIALQTADGVKFYEFAPPIRPNIPGYVTGYSIDSLHIKLQWNGNGQKYLIYKGENKNTLALYDSTASLFYTDNNVLANKYYYYGIKTIDGTKEIPESELSHIIEVYSHNPAFLTNAASSSSNSVNIYFSDRINNTIENLKSFEVIGRGIPNSVTASSQFSYLLSFNESLNAGANRVVVKNLRDYYGSPVKDDTLTFNVIPAEEVQEFHISSYEIPGPYRIKITFNLDINAAAVNSASYIFEPVNNIASITVDPSDSKTIYIDLAKEKPVGSIGKEYRLKIENLISASGIAINSGAGSYLVLVGYANDLSDVYVYPSPVKLYQGNEKIIFANLPQKARITVLNIEGKQLFNLEENDGNGGVEYDLRDDNGDLLSSGVYIYRIVRLDNNNNEVEEKIGKFAVIR